MNLIHLHPMLVHFPIALVLVAVIFNLAAFYFKQEWLTVTLTVFAALGALATVLSGFFLTKSVAGLAATLKADHGAVRDIIEQALRARGHWAKDSHRVTPSRLMASH